MEEEKKEPVTLRERMGTPSLEPTIAVFPFQNFISDPESSYFALGFSYELMVELTKFEDLQVFSYLNITDYPEEGPSMYPNLLEKGIRFAIRGAIHGDRERINVLVELRDLFEGKQIWGERYSKKMLAEHFIEIQEHVAREISGTLGSEYGIVLRRLTLDAQRQKPKILATYTAILKYYNSLVHHTPETVAEAFNALKKAVENEPGSGIALCCLGALYGQAYCLDYLDAEKSYAMIGDYAERAYLLDPNNLLVINVLVFKCFVYNEKDRFFQLADLALTMEPKGTLRKGSLGFHMSLYGDWERGKQVLDSVIQGNMQYPRYLHGATTLYHYVNRQEEAGRKGSLGFHMSLYGDWERGKQVLDSVIQGNMQYPRYLHGATTLYHYRQESYEKALTESKLYQMPGFFWAPLLRAAVLGQLNRQEEAGTELGMLKQMKPDFEKKAHYLVSRFVKEEPLVVHILEGLQKAGLHMS
jgi:TolB-like protein